MRAKKQGKMARQKTPEQRRRYSRQIGRSEASGTADIERGLVPDSGVSTYSRPSVEGGLDAPSLGGGAPRGWSLFSKDNAQAIIAILAGVGLLVGATVYISGMKTDIRENSVAIKALEKTQDSFGAAIRQEIQRVERGIEKRLDEMMIFFRGRSTKGSGGEISGNKVEDKK
jgi:hypothetical protein